MERRKFFKNIIGHGLSGLSDTHFYTETVNGTTFATTVQKDTLKTAPVLSCFNVLNLPILQYVHTVSIENTQNWQGPWAEFMAQKFKDNKKILLTDGREKCPEGAEKLVWLGKNLPDPMPQVPTLLVVQATEENTEDLMPFLAQLPEGSDVFAVLEGEAWPSPLIERIERFCQTG